MLPASPRRVPSWIAFALPILVAAWFRFRGLGNLEPFVDESGNILTALDLRTRTLIDPLGQGRPALAYLFAPAGWFPAHAVEVARGMSALAGTVTLIALGCTLQMIAGRVAALCGLWLWALFPLAVFHERLALQDPFVTMLLAGAMPLLILADRGEKREARLAAIAAGGLFGMAVLSKISAIFALPWLTLFYVAFQRERSRPLFTPQLAFVALGSILPLLALGGDVFQLGGHSTRFGSLPSFAADNYWSATFIRLKLWLGWHAGYGGWPLGVLLIGGIGLVVFRPAHRLLAAACVGGALLAIFVAALFYARPYARYMLPDQLPLILFLALAWSSAVVEFKGRGRLLVVVLFSVALGRWGVVAQQIVATPSTASVPRGEREQYFTGPWSGRGVNEVRRFLLEYAESHGVRCWVVTHGFMRPGCYALLLTERYDPRIAVVPFSVYQAHELGYARLAVARAAGDQPSAFFILFEGSLYPELPGFDAPGSPLQRVLEVPRGAGESFVLYQWGAER
jgi:hypothetical protein